MNKKILWVLLLLATLLASCNKSQQDIGKQSVEHASIQKMGESTDIQGISKIFTVSELATPESFQYDPDTEKYFISNITENPLKGKGFISRLSKDGKMDIREFIIELNAPAGIAFLDKVLYVADADTVKGYDPKTARQMFAQSLATQGAKGLNDVVSCKDFLFISDIYASIVFKLVPATRQVSIFTSSVPKPNGLAIHPGKNTLTVVSWDKFDIVELDMTTGSVVNTIKNNWEHLDGAAYNEKGDVLYVSAFEEGTIYKIAPERGTIEKIVENIITPADISFQQDASLLLIPCFKANEAMAIKIK